MLRLSRALMTLACLSLTALPVSAAVFQYRVDVEIGKNGDGTPQIAPILLWIPPAAKQIRGIMIAPHTLAEPAACADPLVRKHCAEAGIAIAFSRSGIGGRDWTTILPRLAAVTGYKELAVAPMMFIGHSANGPAAKALALQYADRCFALMQYRGGGPMGHEERDKEGNVTKVPPVPVGIPCLMMVGQFDEFGGRMRDENGYEAAWQNPAKALADFRTENENHVLGMVVEPGAGHFAWSERNGALLGAWIKKAAAARIPAQFDASKPPTLKAVDVQTGWLLSTDIKNSALAAPYAEYSGEKGKASWMFDKELADAVLAYQKGVKLKDQFIKWRDAHWIDAGVRHFFAGLKWIDDGQTFEVHPEYADKYPPQPKPGQSGSRWADAGKPAGHSSAPILVKHVGGPVTPVGPNKLRVQFDNLTPFGQGGRTTFMAYSDGDAEYRHTEQVGMAPRGFGAFKAGKPQEITFPPIGDLKVGAAPVELKATSSVGVPVEYYVAYGPAEIAKGKLQLAEVPANAKFPIEICVVAYHFGSGVEPKIQTAAPKEQVIKLEK